MNKSKKLSPQVRERAVCMVEEHGCIFQSIPVTESIAFLSVIPRESGHGFHGISVSDFRRFRSV